MSDDNETVTTEEAPVSDSESHLLELDNLSKYYGNIIALTGRDHVGERRRGHLCARRQRRRQVDVHQDPRRVCTSPVRGDRFA